jgi:hypothetical protein
MFWEWDAEDDFSQNSRMDCQGACAPDYPKWRGAREICHGCHDREKAS